MPVGLRITFFFFLLIKPVLIFTTFYAMSWNDEVQESAHLFASPPKGFVVFGFSLYAGLESLLFSILSACSVDPLLLPRDHLTTFAILSHCFRISLLRCVSFSVMPEIAGRVPISVFSSDWCLLSFLLRR